MVCFSNWIRRTTPLVLSAVMLFSAGCNYHGRLKRGIYKTPSFDDKIDASVLVVADKFLQHTFTFKDYNLTPINSYVIRVDDGAAVASADALATLFSRVHVDEYRFRHQYDYVAEIDYHVEERGEEGFALIQNDRYLWVRKYWIPQFYTTVTLTLRNPNTRAAVIKLNASRLSYLEFNNAAVGVHWFNQLTFSLLFPVIAPVYTQTAGASIRKTLEQDLRACLRKIMRELEENRVLFARGPGRDSFPRNDHKYRELMKKTTYVETPTGHGSGFFISEDGYMITNAHVVEGQRDARYYLYEDLPFEPWRSEPPFRYARVVKVNHSRDLALLKAEGKFPYFELDDDRSHYKTGETVLALGNPEDEYWTMTEGIISALKNDNGVDTIHTDAAVNQGNSGGPLVLRATGKVIGVTSSGIVKHIAEGINFAITAFEVKRTLGIDQPIDEEKLLREEVEALPVTKPK